jgi:hypothetical protein
VARRKTVKLFEPKADESAESGLDRERLLADANAFADARQRGDAVEEASNESFPASDAPSFTSTGVGRKKRSEEEPENRSDDSK